jgi:calpain-15
MSVVDFEVHLDQSENIELEGQVDDTELKTVNNILPFETKEVARVILKNNWKLKSKFKLTMNVPSKDIQNSYVENDEKMLQDDMSRLKKLLKTMPIEIMTKDRIENELDKIKMKFIDLDFIPNDDAMVNSRFDANLKDLFDYVIHWRRPEQFCLGDNVNDPTIREIKIFNYNEPEPNDITQVILPDNHFVSAISALAEKPDLLKRLFKNDKYSSQGVYQVKLCICGEWLTVTIDDLFPCIPQCNPLVSKSPGNELWVLILEKALAKVYDSYYSLIHVNITDFLLVLTGCPTIYVNLDEIVRNDNAETCVKKIKQYLDRRYIMVAMSKSSDNEMNNDNSEYDDDMLTIPNMGYTILDIKPKTKDNLIVLRKVWFDQKKEEKIKKYEDLLVRDNPLLKSEINESTLILSKLF